MSHLRPAWLGRLWRAHRTGARRCGAEGSVSMPAGCRHRPAPSDAASARPGCVKTVVAAVVRWVEVWAIGTSPIAAMTRALPRAPS